MLSAADSLLLVVDAQAGLARAVAAADARFERLGLLLEAAGRLDVPVIVSEHYPEGLGASDPRLAPLPATATVLAKRAFSCWREPALRQAIEAAGRRQIVVAGMETHVCVLQTALDLKAAGYAVHLAADAAGSRTATDRDLGIARLRDAGVAVVTAEMAVFEWLERGEGPAFKALIGRIKARGDESAPRAGDKMTDARRIAGVSLLVPDYDEAIAYFTGVLGFALIEDTPLSTEKRWVRVAPGAGSGPTLLLARAAGEAQTARIGDQTGGRVFLFLDTPDCVGDYERLCRRGVVFEAPPRQEAYGVVAVFRDRYGNRWDLVQRHG